jgi:hypothetical protein
MQHNQSGPWVYTKNVALRSELWISFNHATAQTLSILLKLKELILSTTDLVGTLSWPKALQMQRSEWATNAKRCAVSIKTDKIDPKISRGVFEQHFWCF